MKTINKNLYFLFLIILMSSCSKEESDFITSQEENNVENIVNAKLVDVNDNGIEVTVTTDYLKNKWEKSLIEEGYDVKLGKFEILEGYDDGNNEKIYFLRTISSDGTVNTGAFLKKTDREGVYRLGWKTCTCQGCPTGCNLKIEGDKCSCTSCPGPNKSCTKTETGGTGNQ